MINIDGMAARARARSLSTPPGFPRSPNWDHVLQALDKVRATPYVSARTCDEAEMTIDEIVELIHPKSTEEPEASAPVTDDDDDTILFGTLG